MKKKKFLCFLALLLTLLPPDAASMAQTNTSVKTATGSDAEPLEAVKVITPYSDVLILAGRQSARELLEARLNRDDYSSAVVLFSDRTRAFYPIQYDVETFDVTRTGLFHLNGTIDVPDDNSVSIDPELLNITVPVFLYDPEAPCQLPVRSAEPVRDSQKTLSQDSSLEDLQKALKFNSQTYVYLDDGVSLEVPLIWDVSSVAFGTPGTYRITGKPDLPEGILLSDAFSSFPCDVIIQENGVFSLSAPTFHGIYFMTRWTKPTQQLEKFRRYYAIGDDGEWQEDTTGKFMQINGFNAQYMYVFYYEDVLFEVPYYFRLEYDGEYSNIIKIYLSEDDLHFDLIEGDRDGGDREEQTPPAVILPPDPPAPVPPLGTAKPEETTAPETQPETQPEAGKPAPPQPDDPDDEDRERPSSNAAGKPGSLTPPPLSEAQSPLPESESFADTPKEQTGESAEASASAASGQAPSETAEANAALPAPALPSQEADTADYTILSGKRIHKELELNPGRPIVIAKHRIRLEIPADTGLFSGMSGQSLFRAEIKSPADNQISVELSMDGEPMTNLPSMTVTMPWKAAGDKPVLEVINEDGEPQGTVSYLDSSTISFQLSETGVFTIKVLASASPASVELPDPAALANGQAGDSVSAKSSSAGLFLCVLLAGILVSGFLVLRFRSRKRRDSA